MISKEKDYYKDDTYTVYNEVKQILKEEHLVLQVFAVGHQDDFRLSINSVMKDGKVEKVDIKEQEIIPFHTIIPSGSKFYFLDSKSIAMAIQNGKTMLIRDMLSHGMFMLFEDDVIDYELIYVNKKSGIGEENILVQGNDEIGKLQINIKELREKGFVLKNSLMKLKFKIEKYGKLRTKLEELSFLTETKNTVEYLEFLTSKDNVSKEIEKLHQQVVSYNERISKEKDANVITELEKNQSEVVNLIKDRLTIFNIDTKELDKTNVLSYIELIPNHFDYEFGDVVNIEGFVNNLGGNFSNDFLYEMDYENSNVRLEQLKIFIKEKLLKVS